MIEGTFLALEHMSTQKGGKGGAIVNVSSFGGNWHANFKRAINDCIYNCLIAIRFTRKVT